MHNFVASKAVCVVDLGKVAVLGWRPSAADLATADAGKVRRLGGRRRPSAAAPATADAGKVRLGGSAPALATADAGKVRRPAALATADAGKVSARRPASGARALPPVDADAGKVRLGGSAPTLATADAGKVRLGGSAPTLATAEGRTKLETRYPIVS